MLCIVCLFSKMIIETTILLGLTALEAERGLVKSLEALRASDFYKNEQAAKQATANPPAVRVN